MRWKRIAAGVLLAVMTISSISEVFVYAAGEEPEEMNWEYDGEIKELNEEELDLFSDEEMEEADEILEESALDDEFYPEKMSRAGANSDIVVVLDPGHGGTDGGAARTWNGVYYKESDINLSIAKYAKAELETYEGITVYMTRTKDVAVGLEKRVDIARDRGASSLISLHNNSTNKTQDTVSGSLVFVSNGNYRKNIAQEGWNMANLILSELSKVGLKNRGMYKNSSLEGNKYPNGKLADYYAIVRYGIQKNVPSIIVEHAFVNNPSDCKKYLQKKSSLKKLGIADATAIAKYYGLKKKDGGSPQEQEENYGWQIENEEWYYVNSNGYRMKGFNVVDGDVYYFDQNGYRVTGWQNLEVNRYYFNSDGVMSKHVTKIGKKHYYFNAKGWLKTGLIAGKGGKRYYASKNGVLKSGWKKYKKKWYYFDPVSYEAATGMQKIEGKWYYFNEKGVRKTGWQKVGNDSYYFKENGIRKTGWVKDGKKKYYLDKKTGKMLKKKWVESKGHYYYMNKQGVMLSNTTKKIKGKKYKFASNGICTNKKK